METFQVAQVVQVLSGWPATAGLFVAGFLLVWPRDWRVCLLVLVAIYTLAGIHLAAFTQPELALVCMLTGGLVASLLWMGAVRQETGRGGPWAGGRLLPGLFRLTGVVLLALGAVAAGWVYTPDGFSTSQTVAAGWLVAAGLLSLAFSGGRGVLAAAGILTILVGGEIFVLMVAGSLALAAALSGLHLLLAATLAYLLGNVPVQGERRWL